MLLQKVAKIPTNAYSDNFVEKNTLREYIGQMLEKINIKNGEIEDWILYTRKSPNKNRFIGGLWIKQKSSGIIIRKQKNINEERRSKISRT